MAVVNTPDNVPAANSCGYLEEVRGKKQADARTNNHPESVWSNSINTAATCDRAITYVRISSGVFCCSFLPSPNPKKHTANMGVTPMIGAAIPL